jgi:hypothetical protein
VALTSGFDSDHDALPIRACARALNAKLKVGESIEYVLREPRLAYLVPSRKRSRRRIRDLMALAAFQSLSENEIGCARISMMARSDATCGRSIQKCHEQTHALQQLPALFDHLVGAQQERFRYRGAERPGGFEIYD